VVPAPTPARAGDGPTEGTVAERLNAARHRVRAAAEAAGREPDQVRILLATKTMPPSVIKQALAAGATLIGENRVQEVVAKADALAGFPHTTHFIGHLQSNKVNQVLPHIQCLQTLDSTDLIGRLQSRLEKLDRDMDVLIQVNVSGESSKSGIAPAGVRSLAEAVGAASRLHLRGFMTIGLNSPDRDAVRRGYRELAAIRTRAARERWPGAEGATELSMGMSGDFADAIAEGATIVRLGSAVFGPRPTAATPG
jgi:pyridoxal phosphate enzyme (YggS family)